MATTIPTTTLSAGKVIYAMLTGNTDITSRVTKVFPVVASEKALLPYIRYCRTAMSSIPQKAGAPAADTAVIVVECYTSQYMEGVELAEIVRSVLDFSRYSDGNMRMRSCTMVDSAESWENDAYIQELTFQVKI